MVSQTVKKFLVGLFLVPVIGFSANSLDKGRVLIQKMGHHSVKIVHTFSGPDHWVGYVVVPKGTKRGTVVFTNSEGTYLFAGNIFDKKGENLTQKYTKQYVVDPMAKAVHLDIKKKGWFTEGKNSSPHKAYIVLDPNCIYCHMLYDRIQTEIDSGKLQVRWVPVGVVKPSSKGKAAQLMFAKGDQSRVALLRKDEEAFKLKIEEGGISPLRVNRKDQSVTDAFNIIEHNNTLFTQYEFIGTPIVIYLNHQQKPKIYTGYPRGNALPALLADMSGQW